ncbi:type IV toxin-antitoxin system AbiEi family antitoxin domain-containing protein [Micrococcus sp. TA1]|uniref:type IV toxin-antitoxin system AbiEi family antitoxin domain-containing protein n=1 Tax=Micrococcus sp. TA1 TaxID=681627 RepID=UPI00161ADEFB|nr:type IV toxin-antitoxin system AbiEi family antitoxin domain-containing protein [Micrococcus sp. TA1]MBB5750231.1 hypothetical protein [Micrococcus sp. TA1]
MTSPANAEPLLIRPTESDGGRSARMLARRAQRGELVRLAPGTYASTRRWLLLSRQDRHRVGAVAFADSRRRPVTFCGATALGLLGYPVVEQVPTLHVRAVHRGDSGTRRQVSPYVNEHEVLKTVAELSTQGLMNGDGRVPVLPRVHRHWNAPGGEAAGAGAGAATDGSPPPAHTRVSVCLEDGTVLGRVRVDPLPAAMDLVFGSEPLSTGTAAADAIMRDHAAADLMAGRARELLPSAAQRTRFDAQWAFADARSESVGESLSRAVIHEAGFVVPELQYAVLDTAGTLIARTDFYWEDIRLTAEFDGLVKYTGRLARPGAGGPVGQDALIREKHREDAIRRQGYGMARWICPDLFTRCRFEAILEQHGVPRRRG